MSTSAMRLVLVSLLPLGMLGTECNADFDSVRVTNQLDQAVAIRFGASDSIQAILGPSTQEHLYLSPSCSSDSLVAVRQHQRDVELARSSGPICNGERWVITESGIVKED